MKLIQNFITSQMFLTEPKFKLLEKPQTAPQQTIYQQLQKLEFRVNFESPRTIKAMDNKGFTKDMLIRRHIVEFKRKEENEQQQQQRYQKHLYELKGCLLFEISIDNLISVLNERAVIKRQLRERLEEGLTPPPQARKYIDPIPSRDLESKLQKEREKEVFIRDTATKEEIINEFRRRELQEKWQKKISDIEQGKTKEIENKVKKIQKQNQIVVEKCQMQKEKSNENLNLNFKLSQSFSDKFILRNQQITEFQLKKIDKLRSKAQKSLEIVQRNKEKLNKELYKQDDQRQKKDLEHELRIQMEKENLKIKMSEQSSKQELKQLRVNEVYQQSMQERSQETLETLKYKLDKREQTLKKKEDQITELLKQHKKDLSQRFERQKYREEIEIQNQEKRITEIKERVEQKDEQIQKFEEMKVIEANVKQDLYSEKIRRQQQLLQKQQELLKNKKEMFLRKQQRKIDKLEQQKAEHQKLYSNTNQSRQKNEMESLTAFQDMQNFKYKSSGDLFKKLESLPTMKPEELQMIKKQFISQVPKIQPNKPVSQPQNNFQQ